MTTRAMGPGAGFDWLKRGVNLGTNNPKAVFGAAAWLLLVALVPTIVQLVLQNGLGMTDPAVMLGLVGFSLLYSLVVMPPLFVGFLRVIRDAEHGKDIRASSLFDGYRDAPLRAIGWMLLMLLGAVVLFGAILMVFGGTAFLAQLGEMLFAMETAGVDAPAQVPTLPDGFGTVFGLMLVASIFFNGVYAISLGQVALGGRAPVGAFADGLTGAIKNLLPLLVLFVIVLVLGLVLALVLGLIVMLLMLVGSLVHPALGVVLAAPVYLAAMLALYVVMFGVAYHMWRDVCGGDAAPADNQVEL